MFKEAHCNSMSLNPWVCLCVCLCVCVYYHVYYICLFSETFKEAHCDSMSLNPWVCLCVCPCVCVCVFIIMYIIYVCFQRRLKRLTVTL